MTMLLRQIKKTAIPGEDYNVRAFGSITDTYSSAFLDLTNGPCVKILIITNTLNTETMISLDGGTSTYIRLAAYSNMLLDLAQNGLVYNGDLRVKYATTPPTGGNLTISAIRETF